MHKLKFVLPIGLRGLRNFLIPFCVNAISEFDSPKLSKVSVPDMSSKRELIFPKNSVLIKGIKGLS